MDIHHVLKKLHVLIKKENKIMNTIFSNICKAMIWMSFGYIEHNNMKRAKDSCHIPIFVQIILMGVGVLIVDILFNYLFGI